MPPRAQTHNTRPKQQVNPKALRVLYDWYSFNIIPLLGKLVAGDSESYRYLVESVRRFPDQAAFAELVRAAGFADVAYENLSFGMVAIHSGTKM